MIRRGDAQSWATFSECGRYRYELGRVWSPRKPFFLVCGLNPSTADERKPDPTITRCLGFAQREGCGGLLMVNAFAWRETDSKLLAGVHAAHGCDPVGEIITNPDGGLNVNDAAIVDAWSRASIRVAAWGAPHKSLHARVHGLAAAYPWQCFRLTKDGFPEHPLYMPRAQPLRRLPA
jgi:hypothetical protein